MYSPDDPSFVPYDVDEIAAYDDSSLPYIPYTPYTPPQLVDSPEQTPAAPELSATPAESPVLLKPRKKRRVRLWLTLGLAVLLLIASGVSSFAYVSYLNRSTPEKTLRTFCGALQQGSYQVAYNQMTTGLQTQITEPQFASTLAADKVSKCSYGKTSEATTTTQTNLTLVHSQSGYVNRDLVTLTKEADSIWRISNLANAT